MKIEEPVYCMEESWEWLLRDLRIRRIVHRSRINPDLYQDYHVEHWGPVTDNHYAWTAVNGGLTYATYDEALAVLEAQP
ncbi:MAG TPA: hypothetical protein VFQ54_02155 [Thermomicrobiales bacterium]|nr:hypothetical protein [Thermomicrobiales bacterium]